jgi:hypothetical protein
VYFSKKPRKFKFFLCEKILQDNIYIFDFLIGFCSDWYWHSSRRYQPSKSLDLPGSVARTSSLRSKIVYTNQISRSQSTVFYTTQAKCFCIYYFLSFCWRIISLIQKAAFMPHVDIFISIFAKIRRNACQF